MNAPRAPADDIAATLRAGTRRAPLRPWMAWSAGGALAALLGAFLVFGSKPAQYKSEAVTRGAFSEIVTATGTVQPSNTVVIGSQISGQIAEVNADYNDSVKAGDILARIDTRELEARIAQTKAALASAQAALLQAQANAKESEARRKRIDALAARGNASAQDLDTAEANAMRAEAAVAAAQAQIESAKAALAIEETNLSRATIRAPIDGVILERDVEPGQTVAATFQTPVLFKLAEDLTHMKLEADIDEADVGLVKAGLGAHFTVDAYPERRFDATMRSVRFAPVTTNGVVTYKGELDAPNADLALRPGMTATVEIVISQTGDGVLVPSGALRFTPPGLAAAVDRPSADEMGLPALKAVKLKAGAAAPALDGFQVVWTGQGSAPRPVAVRTGPSDGFHTLLREGALQPGDAVLTDIARPAKP